MIKDFAFSASCIGYYLTERHLEAFRRSAIRNIELPIAYALEGTDESNLTKKILGRIFAEKVLSLASIHLPFGSHCDISSTDEATRRAAVEYTANMIREARAFAHSPEMTLHAGAEQRTLSPLERKARTASVRRSIAELLPDVVESDSRLNIEYLPRTCIGNCEEELLEITDGFDSRRVGINLDVNHVMNRYNELPAIASRLIDRINVCHFSDYDGVDEQHWGIPHSGVIDWRSVMSVLEKSPNPVTIIFEWSWILKGRGAQFCNPALQLKALNYAKFYLTHLDDFKATDSKFEEFC